MRPYSIKNILGFLGVTALLVLALPASEAFPKLRSALRGAKQARLWRHAVLGEPFLLPDGHFVTARISEVETFAPLGICGELKAYEICFDIGGHDWIAIVLKQEANAKMPSYLHLASRDQRIAPLARRRLETARRTEKNRSA